MLENIKETINYGGDEIAGFKEFLKATIKEAIAEIETEKTALKKGRKRSDKTANPISDIIIDEVYNTYPTRCKLRNRSTGKGTTDKHTIKTRLKQLKISPLEMIGFINWYLVDCEKSEAGLKNFSTFLNHLPPQDELLLKSDIGLQTIFLDEVGIKHNGFEFITDSGESVSKPELKQRFEQWKAGKL